MCESTVVLRTKGHENVIIANAARLIPNEKGIVIFGILGQKKEISDVKIVEIDLVGHRIILE